MTIGKCNTLRRIDYPNPYPTPFIKINEGNNTVSGTTHVIPYNSIMTYPDGATITNGRYTSTYTLPTGTTTYDVCSSKEISIPYPYSKGDVSNCEVKYCPILWEYDTGFSTYRQYKEETVSGNIINGVLTFTYKKIDVGNGQPLKGSGLVLLRVLY